MFVILLTANFQFRNRSTCSKGPMKRADKVCGDSQDLKSPGYGNKTLPNTRKWTLYLLFQLQDTQTDTKDCFITSHSKDASFHLPLLQRSMTVTDLVNQTMPNTKNQGIPMIFEAKISSFNCTNIHNIVSRLYAAVNN